MKIMERRGLPFRDVEFRERSSGTLNFAGYASVTEAPFEIPDHLGCYIETVKSGAFAKTLQDGADVNFLVNHAGMSLARTKSGTLRLAEDSTGLLVNADLDPANPRVVELRSGIDRGDISEMSLSFCVTRQRWSGDWTQRDIQEVSLAYGDVSAVNYGANPVTSIESLRDRGHVENARLRARIEPALSELRSGKAISAANLEQLRAVLAALSAADRAIDPIVSAMIAADGALDEAQAVLSGMVGAPNPDGAGGDIDDEARRAEYAATLRLIDLDSFI